MAFILDRLKEKFKDEDEEEDKGYDDLNYIVGESSAMDVGEVPTPLDERIGYASMIGGKLMELQITNPATFELEREQMIRTIDQLGLDITLHPDMNAGFTSAQKSGQGEQYGYETVEQYFTNYLQELAQFKHHVQENTNANFQIGRMNPHISTSPQPPLQERMETDVGLDPFGYVTNTYDEQSRKKRNYKSQNIYKNPEFLRKLYYTMFLEIANYPFQNYQTFASYSDEFDQEWLKAQHMAARTLLNKEANDFEDVLGAIQTAERQDQGVDTSWLELVYNWKLESIPKLQVNYSEEEVTIDGDQKIRINYDGINETGGKVSLGSLLDETSQRGRGTNLRQLQNAIFRMEEETVRGFATDGLEELTGYIQDEDYIGVEEIFDEINRELEEKLPDPIKAVREGLKDALKYLWNAGKKDGEIHPEEQNISQQAKWQALQSTLEVQQIRLLENAYQIGREQLETNIETLAAKVFSGQDVERFFDKSDRENIESAEKMHEDLLERILTGQQFQRELWKESTLFYQVIPAWMSESSFSEHEGHKGWDAPEFIWDTIVVNKWENRDDIDVELNLENPRNGVYEEDEDDVYHYMDLLENFDEFRMDVAAAVGACYAWGHYTQRKVQFDLKDRDFGLSGEEGSGIYSEMSEKREVENHGWTWVDWMNRFGLGVNLETMAGSPQTRFKIWRPKDISVTAHAINLTARRKLEDNGALGGLDYIHENIDGCPAKFTIDMEHVATMGAPPMHEMDIFFDQEKNLAEDWPELNIDPDKPAAKIMRQMHLMDPGVEGQRGTHHGAFERGNELLYEWLYKFVEHGFARNENEPATILFELAEHKDESSYMMRITMDLIQLGVKPEDLDPARVDPSTKPDSEEEALIGRFYGIERENYTREWAKIEEHAFDPLSDLLEVEPFENTFSGSKAVEDRRLQEWSNEEYR